MRVRCLLSAVSKLIFARKYALEIGISYLFEKKIEKKVHGRKLKKENLDKCVGKLSPRSTQCTPSHRSQSSFFFAEKFANNLQHFLPNLLNF